MKYSLILAALIIISGCTFNNDSNKPGPEQMILELSSNQRFATADQVAHWLIDKEPTLRLVDVRGKEAYAQFTLPGAVNIPLAEFLNPEFRDLLASENHFIVFFSNDDMRAEQAWILNRQSGCSNSFILQGGLNAWTEAIMKVQNPGDIVSSEELELYEFRKAARQYFIGGSQAMLPEAFTPEEAPVVEKKKLTVQPKKKAVAEEEEGC